MADLEFALDRVWRDTPRQRRPEEIVRLLDSLHDPRRTIRLLKVEDWTQVRCSPVSSASAHLIEVVDGSGRLVGRVILDIAGHWAIASFPATAESKRFADPLEAPEIVLRRFHGVFDGLPEEPQWVVTSGTIRCADVAPCLAFRAKGESYIVQDGALFRLELEGLAMKTHEVLTFAAVPEAIQAIRRQILPGRRHLVTVGFDRIVFASRVSP